MITLTENAKNRFHQQLKERGRGIGIIVGVKQTGCSGYAYTLEFADQPHSGSYINCGNFVVIVDPLAEQYIDGLTIDYIKKGLNEQFEFINTKETGRCGCGESFTV